MKVLLGCWSRYSLAQTEKPAKIGVNQPLSISQPCVVASFLGRPCLTVARCPPAAPSTCFTRAAIPVKKRALCPQYSSQSPRAVGSHRTTASYMSIPEFITRVQGMEYANWANLELEVGPLPLNIKDRKWGRDGNPRESQGVNKP